MVLRVFAKSMLIAFPMAVSWGALYYILSDGSLDHARFPAELMFVFASVGGTIFVVALLRSPRRQLAVALGRMRPPSMRLRILVGLLWATTQGALTAWGTGSAGRGLAAGLVVASIFLWIPPLWWRLFRRELLR